MIDGIVRDLLTTPLKRPVKTACAHCGALFLRRLPTYAQMFCSEQCQRDEEVFVAEMLLNAPHPLSDAQERFCLAVLGW